MTAQESFQTFLDAISMCFIHRDFEMWRSRVIYPVSLITSAGPNIIHDDAQLQVNFELYLRACDAMKLDKIYRTPLSLEDCHDGHWIGTYETNMLSHGVRCDPALYFLGPAARGGRALQDDLGSERARTPRLDGHATAGL